ncbi:MAG TPA: cellulase family glycosylhydrolase [Polyangiaceae bacterium]|nr:cellulase family glycosylhydrolase [Polyangiaceae bacterium]
MILRKSVVLPVSFSLLSYAFGCSGGDLGGLGTIPGLGSGGTSGGSSSSSGGANSPGSGNTMSSGAVNAGGSVSSSGNGNTGNASSSGSMSSGGGFTPGGGGNGGTAPPPNGGVSSGTGGSGAGGGTFIPPTPPADAKPTPESSGIPGAFRVNTKTGHLMHDGAEFQVRGGNWFGLEGQDDTARPGAMELYVGAVFWADASNKRTIDKTMQEIQSSALKFNTIRLPVAPQTLVKGHPDGDYSRTDVKIRNNDPEIYPYAGSYEALEDFLLKASKNNLYVILDLHSCSNHIGWRAGRVDDGPPWADSNRENYEYKKDNYYCNKGEDAYDKAKWLADIHTLAKLPKKLGIKNIIGIDCFNEPFKYSWSEWADLSKECYDAIAAEDDDLIAIVEGVSGSHEVSPGVTEPEPYGDLTINPNWGENLYGQQIDPIQIPKDRLCFSPHTYGPSVFVQKQFVDQSDPACVGLEDDAAAKAKCKLVVDRKNAAATARIKQGWDEHFGYLRAQNYCVIVGEFGGTKDWPKNPVEPAAATLWAHLPSGSRPDWEWQNMFVDYMKEKGITDFTYWSINPESGDTGGLYNHAYTESNKSGWGVWQGLDTEKVNMLAGINK